MDQIILDLGSNANILTNQTWELMGKSKLQWLVIYLRLENHHKIFPMGRLLGVTVDIEVVHTTVDFEVMENTNDNNPYPPFLGLDWEFSNMVILNLKKRKMIFESNNMKVIVPLDPLEEARYTKRVKEECNAIYIDNIYQMTTKNKTILTLLKAS